MPTRPTSQDQQEDARRLSVLLKTWLKRQPEQMSQEAIADSLGLSQSALSQRLSGRLAINVEFAANIATLIGCSVDDFSPQLASEIRKLSAALRTANDSQPTLAQSAPPPSIADALDVICETLTSLTGMRLSVARAVLHEVVDHPEMRDDAAQQLERQLADEAQRRKQPAVTPQSAQVYRLPSRRPRTTPPKVGGPSIWVEALDRSWGLFGRPSTSPSCPP